jgi:hypothetical protein
LSTIALTRCTKAAGEDAIPPTVEERIERIEDDDVAKYEVDESQDDWSEEVEQEIVS